MKDTLFEVYKKSKLLAEEYDGDYSVYLTPYGTVTVGEDCLCVSVYVTGNDKETALKEAEKIPEVAVLAKDFASEAVLYDGIINPFKMEEHNELHWETTETDQILIF